MLNLFSRNKQLLDEASIDWIFNAYIWALEQFDKNVFFNETVLVIPDNQYFPGKETSANGMANLIFEQVKKYAGMSHWPTRLYNLEETANHVPQQQAVPLTGELRGNHAVDNFPISSMPNTNSIIFTFHPQQLKSPAGIIAHFAHGLSHHLVKSANKFPPGGQDYLPMAGELTGIFMGFGLMFANSAVVPRSGGCGGCGGGQSPVRQVFMNEDESTYALALFCQLKGIESSRASKHLKKHLRGFFKAAVKDCKQRLDNYTQLKLISEPSVKAVLK